MTDEQLMYHLQDLHDSLSRPLYNSLESGFRHHPLTDNEKLERYKDACEMAAEVILLLMNELKPQ